MNRLHRLLPQRMMSQLGLLMVSAILGANLIAIGGIQLLGNLISPATRHVAVERIELAWLTSQLAPGSPLHIQREDGARFWIADRAEVAPFAMRREERALRAALLQRHGLPADTQVTFQLERSDGGRARWHLFSTARHDPLRLRSSLTLPDGTYLNAVQPLEPAFAWAQLVSLSLLVMVVPLLLLLLCFTNRVVRPIRRLAAASEAISRGEWTGSLPLVGPRESRDLTRSFNLMQQRLARHLEGKTRMLASMSHDLNTPLTELRLQIELMEPGEARDDMLESLTELQSMVGETLNFIRDDVAQEETRRCDLNRLAADLAERYRQRGLAVSWQGDGEVTLACRPLAIKRALSNLIENALAWAGDARVSLSAAEGWVTIEVQDSGPGIDEALLDRVFEPFVRLQPERADAPRLGGGLGLGLSIARACVHAHGGELILENRPPAGLCATILLPEGIRK